MSFYKAKIISNENEFKRHCFKKMTIFTFMNFQDEAMRLSKCIDMSDSKDTTKKH